MARSEPEIKRNEPIRAPDETSPESVYAKYSLKTNPNMSVWQQTSASYLAAESASCGRLRIGGRLIWPNTPEFTKFISQTWNGEPERPESKLFSESQDHSGLRFQTCSRVSVDSSLHILVYARKETHKGQNISFALSTLISSSMGVF